MSLCLRATERLEKLNKNLEVGEHAVGFSLFSGFLHDNINKWTRSVNLIISPKLYNLCGLQYPDKS